ncbi:hypothetical protein DRQ33_07265 [bacterium]|nr:MAG: hypothetical protein DRQ33_07265 [bacterium]
MGDALYSNPDRSGWVALLRPPNSLASLTRLSPLSRGTDAEFCEASGGSFFAKNIRKKIFMQGKINPLLAFVVPRLKAWVALLRPPARLLRNLAVPLIKGDRF